LCPMVTSVSVLSILHWHFGSLYCYVIFSKN
jgi:hypothetical protein